MGRKPILLLGLLGYGLSSLLFGLSTELWMLFASRALSGLLSSATSATALAYISDSTSERDRGGGLGMLGAAIGLGMILGPAAGGWLGAIPLAALFHRRRLVPAGAAAGALAPESLPAAERQTAAMQRSDLGALGWRALPGPLGVLMLLVFVVSFGLTNFQSVFGLYAAEEVWLWPGRGRWILTVLGSCLASRWEALIGPLTKRWGEAPIIKVSLAASAAGFGLLLTAEHPAGVLLATGSLSCPRPCCARRDLAGLKAGRYAAGRCHGAQQLVYEPGADRGPDLGRVRL